MSTRDATRSEPAFGGVLAVRQRRAFFLFLAALVGALGMLLILGAAAMLVGVLLNTTRRGPRPPGFVWTFDLIILLVGIALALAARWAIRQARTKVIFQQLGAVRTRGKSRVALAYAEAVAFAMRLTHQSYHGMYAGSVVRLTLRGPDTRSISYTGGYKVKMSGLLKRRYELLDELERVRQVIADQMGDVLIERMLRGEPIDWCARAALTPDGFIPRGGPHRGKLLPYKRVTRQAMLGQALALHGVGNEVLLIFDPGAVNFWPGYSVFLRLAEMHAVTESLPGEEAEDGDDVPDND